MMIQRWAHRCAPVGTDAHATLASLSVCCLSRDAHPDVVSREGGRRTVRAHAMLQRSTATSARGPLALLAALQLGFALLLATAPGAPSQPAAGEGRAG